jgi:hypothetical protein
MGGSDGAAKQVASAETGQFPVGKLLASGKIILVVKNILRRRRGQVMDQVE